MTIGRGEQSALRIDDPSVSRNHAILRVSDGLEVEDLGSANGTLLRGRTNAGSSASETLNVRHLLKRGAPLSVGDSIIFGTTSVVVRHKPKTEALDLGAGNPGVIVRDPAMRAIYEQAALAARSSLNVLVCGESHRHRQGAGRARDPHAIAPPQGRARAGQLRRAAGLARRERAVRSRARRVLRRAAAAGGPVRGRDRRPGLPRRGRRAPGARATAPRARGARRDAP